MCKIFASQEPKRENVFTGEGEKMYFPLPPHHSSEMKHQLRFHLHEGNT